MPEASALNCDESDKIRWRSLMKLRAIEEPSSIDIRGDPKGDLIHWEVSSYPHSVRATRWGKIVPTGGNLGECEVCVRRAQHCRRRVEVGRTVLFYVQVDSVANGVVDSVHGWGRGIFGWGRWVGLSGGAGRGFSGCVQRGRGDFQRQGQGVGGAGGSGGSVSSVPSSLI